MAKSPWRDARARAQTHPLSTLPYTFLPARGPRLFWRVPETGDWRQDCLIGAAMARQALAYLASGEDGAFHHIGDVARDITAQGRFGGIEAGFFHGIGAALVRAAAARRPS